MRSLRAVAESVLARVATIGADSQDSDERRFRKALLVVIAVLILPILLNTGDPGAKRKEAVSRRPPPDTWGGWASCCWGRQG